MIVLAGEPAREELSTAPTGHERGAPVSELNPKRATESELNPEKSRECASSALWHLSQEKMQWHQDVNLTPQRPLTLSAFASK